MLAHLVRWHFLISLLDGGVQVPKHMDMDLGYFTLVSSGAVVVAVSFVGKF